MPSEQSGHPGHPGHSDPPRTHGSRGRRFLYSLLIAVLLTWLATWPLRSRLVRETSRINGETVKEEQALRRTRALDAGIDRANAQVASAPRSFQARLTLASALGLAHRYPEAIRELQTAEQLAPKSPRPHAALGQIYDAAGLPDLALPEMHLAVEMDPGDVSSLTLMAYRYIALGWSKDAERTLLGALKLKPRDVELHVTLGLNYSQTDDQLAAQQQLLIARKLAPHDPAIAYPLIEVYRHSQRYADALRTIAEVAPLVKDPTFLDLERAETYMKMNQPAPAINWANAALARNPKVILAHYVRGVCLKLEGHNREAIQDLEAVKRYNPSTERTLLLLSQLYLSVGDKVRGQEVSKEYQQNEDLANLMVQLTQRVAYQPHDADAHRRLGEFYARGGSYARAIVELKRALELNPGDLEARAWLVRSLLRRGRGREAALLDNGLPLQEPASLAP